MTEGVPARGTNRFLDGMRDQVLKNAREAIVAEAARHTYRDSPSALTRNDYPLTLRFDPETGKVIPEGKPAKSEIRIRYQLLPDQNRVVLDPETAAGLRDALKALRPEEDVLRGIFLGLLELPQHPILLPRGNQPALEAASGTGGALVLPEADSGIFHFNQDFLSGKREGGAHQQAIAMTILMGGDSAALTHFYQVGTLSLDAEGRIVGSALGRPDFQSPRGTQYRQGMARGSDQVAVILHGETVVWLGPLDELNPKQQSAMLALAGTSAVERSRLLADDPYAVDAILGQGLGRMARDLSAAVMGNLTHSAETRPDGSMLLKLRLGLDEHGVWRASPESVNGQEVLSDVSLARPLGGLQLVVKASDAGQSAYLGGMLAPRIDRFEYHLAPGMEHREEIEALLNYLQRHFQEAPSVEGASAPKKLP